MNWFKELFGKCRDALIESKQASKKDEGILVSAQAIACFPEFKVKRVFFQELNNAPHMYFILDSGECFELPVQSDAAIALYTQKGILGNLKGMENKQIEILNRTVEQLESLRKIITMEENLVQKKPLKKVMKDGMDRDKPNNNRECD